MWQNPYLQHGHGQHCGNSSPLLNGNALPLPHALSMIGSPPLTLFLWTTCHKKPYPHLSPIMSYVEVGRFGQAMPPFNHIPPQQWPKAFGHVGARLLHLSKISLPPSFSAFNIFTFIATKHPPTFAILVGTFCVCSFNLPWARITSSKSCLHSCTLLHYACMLHMK